MKKHLLKKHLLSSLALVVIATLLTYCRPRNGAEGQVISMDLKPYDWTEDVKNIKAPIFMAIGDADGVRHVGIIQQTHLLLRSEDPGF